MLSGFFKRLLMARQLQFLEGDIKIFDTEFCMYSINHYLFIRAELETKYGSSGLDILYSVGKQTARDMSQYYAKKFELRGIDSLNFWKNIIELNGLGRIKTLEPRSDGTALIQLESPFAKRHLSLKGKQETILLDNYLAGIFAGILSEIYNKEMDCRETRCISGGETHCEFIATPKA